MITILGELTASVFMLENALPFSPDGECSRFLQDAHLPDCVMSLFVFLNVEVTSWALVNCEVVEFVKSVNGMTFHMS